MSRPVIEMRAPQWVLDNKAAERRAADRLVWNYSRGVLTPAELAHELTLLVRS